MSAIRCTIVCAVNAIVAVQNEKVTITDSCTNCGTCTTVCPHGAIQENKATGTYEVDPGKCDITTGKCR